MKNKMPDTVSGDTLFRKKVEKIVEERIRPSLRLHDGDLSVRKASDGEVWVVFAGACRTCPSAQVTIEEVVAQILREELGGEFKAVHLVNETDKDLLDFARQLLNKNK